MFLNFDEQFSFGDSQENDSIIPSAKEKKSTNPNILIKLQKNKPINDNSQASPSKRSPVLKKSSPPLKPASNVSLRQKLTNSPSFINSTERKSLLQQQNTMRKKSLINTKEIGKFNDSKILEGDSISSKKKDREKYNNISNNNHDPKFFIEESKKLLKKGCYRKAYSILEIFFKYNKNFSIEAQIKLNRMITIAINKICRHKYFNKFYMTDTEKINQYLDQSTTSFKSWFKYLSIYIFINQQSHLSLLDLNKRMVDFDLGAEENFVKKQKAQKLVAFEYECPLYQKTPKGFLMDNGLEQEPKVLNPKGTNHMIEFEQKSRFIENHTHNNIENDDKDDLNSFFNVNILRNLKENGTNFLNLNYESTEFIKCLMDTFLNFSIFYVFANNYKIAYKYAHQLNEISYMFDDSIDVDLLRVIAKGKMQFITFLFHFDLYKKAMIVLEETLIIVQKELNIRINLKIINSKLEKRKTKQKFLSCVRMMIIVIMSLGTAFKRIGKIDKFVELSHMANGVGERLLPKSDNLRISMNKFCNGELNKFREYLSELSEIEYLIKDFLKNDYDFLLKLEKTPPELNQIIASSDSYLYKKFNYKNYNNSTFIPVKKPEKDQNTFFGNDISNLTKNMKINNVKISHLSINTEKMLINKNNLNMKPISHKTKKQTISNKNDDPSNMRIPENSFNSFLNESDNSSIECSTILSDSPLLSVYSLRMKKLKNKKKTLKFFNKKEFSKDYNPKLLTTAEYFDDYDSQSHNANPAKNTDATSNNNLTRILITDIDKSSDPPNLNANNNNNNSINKYYITKSVKNINKPQNLKEIQENVGCHSDLFFKMNANYINPKLMNISETNSRTHKENDALKERDLDYYMDKKIKENLEKKYQSRRFHQINENFYDHLKKEEFDKKEFSYCRKMLLMKKKEALREGGFDNDEFFNQLKINKAVKTEAEDISNKFGVQTIILQDQKKSDNQKKILIPEVDEEDPEKEKPEKTNKFIDIILKHKKSLNLEVVSEQIMEMRKENEKKEKKQKEKKKSILKLQDQTFKWAYYANMMDATSTQRKMKESPKTAPNNFNPHKQFFYNMNKCETHKNDTTNTKMLKGNTNTVSDGHRFSIELMKFNQTENFKKENKEGINNNIGITNKNSMNSIENIDNIENDKKFTSLANNMIKILTEDIQKEMHVNEKEILNKNHKKGSKTDRNLMREKYRELAKSASYLSLKKETKQKILSFEELLTLKTKLHYQGTKSFFGNRIMSHIFKKIKNK